MSIPVKTLLHTPKGKLILALACMVIVWTGLFLYMSPGLGNLLPDEEDMERLRSEIKKSKSEFSTQDQKMRAMERTKKDYEAKLLGVWQEDVSGDVELELRDKIGKTAQEAGITLTSLGSVRISKINGALVFAELDVSFSDGLEDMAKFLAAIQKLEPELSWKRADMRPEIRRVPQPNNRTGSAVTAVPEVTEPQIRFYGALRVICLESKAEREADK